MKFVILPVCSHNTLCFLCHYSDSSLLPPTEWRFYKRRGHVCVESCLISTILYIWKAQLTGCRQHHGAIPTHISCPSLPLGTYSKKENTFFKNKDSN